MRKFFTVASACLLGATAAAGAECPGNSQALGTSRIIEISTANYGRIGTMQYKRTLPLADKEVVLTFDDGPIPPYTTRILQTLASECVKATFFMVGQQARAFPEVVRRVHYLGHTIATHSQHHPMNFSQLAATRVAQEVDQGISATAAALGDRKLVAPFFRIPGLNRSPSVENQLSERGLSVWSADFAADDWRHISSQMVMERALARLERKGKGVLLLHDIQPATALALPHLLRELKARGYRIVHVVPSGAMPPKPAAPDQIASEDSGKQGWPRLTTPSDRPAPALPSAEGLGWPKILDMWTHAAASGPADNAQPDEPLADQSAAYAEWPDLAKIDVKPVRKETNAADNLPHPQRRAKTVAAGTNQSIINATGIHQMGINAQPAIPATIGSQSALSFSLFNAGNTPAEAPVQTY